MDPPLGWANLADCGNFPCTGPRNLVMKFIGTTYSGSVEPLDTNRDFQIMSNNEQVVGIFDCERKDAWNGYYCQDEDISMLLFES